MRSPPANHARADQASACGVRPPSMPEPATVSKTLCISVLLLWTQQEIKCDCVRDHEQGYVDDRDRVSAAELPRHRGKTQTSGVVVVDDDVDCPHEIEGDDERPKQRRYPCGEKRQNGQDCGGEVTAGGEGGEPGRQIRAYDAREDKDEPEESKAVHVAIARCASNRSMALSRGQM